MSTAVENLKKQGNQAFSAKEYQKAISCYSDAIDLDPENYTIYSNRSGAYCALGKYEQAAADAKKVIGFKPDWVRGHTRLGAALQGLQDWDGAEQAFQKALELDPNNDNIKNDLAQVQRNKQTEESQEAKAGQAVNQLFSEENLNRIAMTNPAFAQLIRDPSVKTMLEDIRRDPRSMGKYNNDQRFMQILSALLTGQMQPPEQPQPQEEQEQEQPTTSSSNASSSSTATPSSQQNANAAAEEEKAKGNAAFKAGNLDEALEHYNKAISIDEFNVTYYNNKATVLSKQGKHEEAIKLCEDAIQKGREHGASYESIARSFQKIASAQVSLGHIDLAIESLKSSLLEKKDPQVQRELKRLETLYEKKKAQEYENPELAEKAREEGNNFFSNKDFPKAIESYTEAIKRAPRNPTLYSNRAAAYSKLGELPMAIKDCEKAIEIDPKFVKAYTRKAYCHYMMKEYYKAQDCYREALKYDPNNAESIDGLHSIDQQIAKNRYTAPDQEQINRAMADPEIQRILQDPGMQQILKECQENPSTIQHYLQDPRVAEAFKKLQAAGIIR